MSLGVKRLYMCVCVCVCVCVSECARACVRVCVHVCNLSLGAMRLYGMYVVCVGGRNRWCGKPGGGWGWGVGG